MKVQQRIEAINQVLSHFGMYLFSEKRGVYTVQSDEREYWMGDDGESNSRPRFVFSFRAKASELTIETVRAASFRVHNKTLEEAAATVAAEVAAHEEQVRPIREENERIEAEKQRAYNEAAALVTIAEQVQRNRAVYELAAASDEVRLEFYRQLCIQSRAIVSDDYREDFLRLTTDDVVRAMALDAVRYRNPKLLLSGGAMKSINQEARRRGIKFGSLGAVQDALQYLVSKAS